MNSGVIADISTTAERGKYMGGAQSGIMARFSSRPLVISLANKHLDSLGLQLVRFCKGRALIEY